MWLILSAHLEKRFLLHISCPPGALLLSPQDSIWREALKSHILLLDLATLFANLLLEGAASFPLCSSADFTKLQAFT